MAGSRSSIVVAHMERLRAAELEAVRHWFAPGTRVLEVGGGPGYQASIIQSWGCDVVSIDLPDRTNKTAVFPVLDYDGRTFPCRDGEFDIVFSSNVLEHIPDIDRTLDETRRVLKPQGLSIHLLPTPAWRFWSIATHYPYVLGRFAKALLRGGRGEGGAARLGGLVPPPHGAFPSAWAELSGYSRRAWRNRFERKGFEVASLGHNKLFYTEHVLFPGLGLAPRRLLSLPLGAACNIFVLRRASGSPVARP